MVVNIKFEGQKVGAPCVNLNFERSGSWNMRQKSVHLPSILLQSHISSKVKKKERLNTNTGNRLLTSYSKSLLAINN